MRITGAAIIILSFVAGTGCAQKDSIQKKYGSSSGYYMALQNKISPDKAIDFLKEAEKSSNPLIAEKSLRILSQKGTPAQNEKKVLELYKKFPSEENLELACSILYENKKYSKIISLTQNIDYKKCRNKTAYYRTSSLLINKKSSFIKEAYEWNTKRPYSADHYNLYTEISELNDSIENKVLKLRANVYSKNYTKVRYLVDIVKEKKALCPQTLSDVGKILLYSPSKNKDNDKAFLEELLPDADDECSFYINFYLGRITDNPEYFLTASKKAVNDSQYDNALWYYLSALSKKDLNRCVEELNVYADSFKKRSYYDDFFDSLSMLLISHSEWNLYSKAALLSQKFATEEISAKLSYVAARLIQENYIKLLPKEAEKKCDEYFRIALSSGTDLYYRLNAAKELKLDDKKIEEEIFKLGQLNSRSYIVNENAEKLLLGYIDFDLPQYIYADFQNYKDQLSTDCVIKLSDYLSECGKSSSIYSVQSIRIASSRIFYCEKEPPKKLFELAFPQPYKKEISESCKKVELEDHIFYGLIRSESFFDAKIVSHAGAVGLTQLMPDTASDIAKKLKIKNYDIESPATNIEFGSYYVEELRRRCEGSTILALFAYNGGISRVRKWLKDAKQQFKKENLSYDIFLETLPYAETREYGRKVSSAAAIYGWLYYNRCSADVMEEIFN